MVTQLKLFELPRESENNHKKQRSGTFVDNMALPIHRWFRYSAGFSAQWVEELLQTWNITSKQVVLDPFAGSGTVPIVCDSLNIRSIGVEAHPFVVRILETKLLWNTSIADFRRIFENIKSTMDKINPDVESYSQLITDSFDLDSLLYLDKLRKAWIRHKDNSPESELMWLAITAILRPSSKVGTAQWQYILPRKHKANVVHPEVALNHQFEMMLYDMRWMQARNNKQISIPLEGDAREISHLFDEKIDGVITSPPYANNYDYADALRFEMTFWGYVRRWGDIHDKVRKFLIVSSSQHSSKERLELESLLDDPLVDAIRSELTTITQELAVVRGEHGGKKHYHTMIAAYCRDISLVLHQLRNVCKPGAQMCWMIGDSAPYGVYCPIDRWIGELALSAGFKSYKFEKLRDRNVKWKNRKHNVLLKEGLLNIEG